jgi:FecR-like protein
MCAPRNKSVGGGGDLNLVNINRQSKALLLSRLIALGIVTLAAFAIVASDASAQTPVGVVTAIAGTAAIQRGANSLTPRVGTQLDQGDRLTTGADGHLEGTLSDNSQFELAEASSMALDQMTVGAGGGRIGTRLTLALGALRTAVSSSVGGVPNFEVHTPNAVVAVRGTKWNTRYQESTGRPGFPSCKRFTDVEVYEGTVEVSSATNPAAQRQSVTEGYETTVACDAPPLESGPLGITGNSGIGGFRGVSPGSMGAPPAGSLEQPPVIPKPPPDGGAGPR